jgi:hypothetical protein
MKKSLHLAAIHQPATSLQGTNNLNPRTIWYPALDESNRMKSTFFTIYPGKHPPPQNGCRLKSVFFLSKNTGFTSSTFPNQLDFSRNQPAAITLNTGSPQTLHGFVWSSLRLIWFYVCYGGPNGFWFRQIAISKNEMIECYLLFSLFSWMKLSKF